MEQFVQVINVCEARYVDARIAAASAVLTPPQLHDYGGDGGIGAYEVEQDQSMIGVVGESAHAGHVLFVLDAADRVVGVENGWIGVDRGWEEWCAYLLLPAIVGVSPAVIVHHRRSRLKKRSGP